MNIGIVNVGIGNIGSLKGALYQQGYETTEVHSSTDLKNISHLILPGVGAYSSAMDRLEKAKLIDPIRGFVKSGNPLLGICLGMQILSSFGIEGGNTDGLNLIPGNVTKIQVRGKLRLPHIGWNNVNIKVKHPVIKGLKDEKDFYFVHAYHYSFLESKYIIATTKYGAAFPSIIGNHNIVGMQFHPEKSQRNGLMLLDNFCMWNGLC